MIELKINDIGGFFMKQYEFQKIEAKWQKYWEEHKIFRTPMPNEPGFEANKPKFYVLDMFPYPSGKGLHVGHPLGYISTDIAARYKRMTGHNVLHPMGFDAFGLPAEQYAVETGTHPQVTTENNIKNMERQLKAIGLSYDWDREIATTDPKYYKWTQWIFLKLFESWFDPKENRARPIQDLVSQCEEDKLRVASNSKLISKNDSAFKKSKRWSALSNSERSQVLNEYRLAYVQEAPVNWCPELGTVLANEEVTNEGRSERGNYPVYQRLLKQWMLRITDYADRLIDDLKDVHWPKSIKEMQRNWIGRSEGARVYFPVKNQPDKKIEIFTTCPHTLFGATFMVLAPEHPWVDQITSEEEKTKVKEFQKKLAQKTELERQAETKTKEGVFIGAYAINPANNEKIPIWIADYVLMGYGTAAIMAVPAHDQRDFEFAKKYKLLIRAVVEPSKAWLEAEAKTFQEKPQKDLRQFYFKNPEKFSCAFTQDGTSIYSHNDEVSLDGSFTPDAKKKMTAWLEQKGLGSFEIQYKLRDWLFSRQRYWGEPFPILHGEDEEIIGLREEELPLELPPLKDFQPKGSKDPNALPQPSLSRAPKSWRQIKRNGKTYTREFNTMPQWAGSCWYYLRFIDPKNSKRLVKQEAEEYWMKPNGVDLYMGGVEHAVLHLLYARFWHKVLFDLGFVSTKEPFGRLFNQGYIQAYSYQDERGLYVEAEEVKEEKPGVFIYKGQPVNRQVGKMGKSLKNSIGPDDIIKKYGCDTFRLYEMYLGPIEQSKVWDTKAVVGVHRFLQRLWRNFLDEESGKLQVTDEPLNKEMLQRLNQTIYEVTEFMENLRFNTAIAKLIELNNHLVSQKTLPRDLAEPITLMLAPLAPHLAEELWEKLGHKKSLAYAPWPKYDEKYLAKEQIEIVVQVNGKRRANILVPTNADEDQIKTTALQNENVSRFVQDKAVRKAIYVPGRLLNLVVSG